MKRSRWGVPYELPDLSNKILPRLMLPASCHILLCYWDSTSMDLNRRRVYLIFI